MKKEYKIILVVGLFYLIYIMLFLAKFDFNPSATIEMSENNINRFNWTLPSNLVVQVDSGGFDGQIYYMIAQDMPPNNEFVSADRVQRILYPSLAYLFAFGRISLIPWSLLLINYFVVVFGTYFLLLILKKYKANPYLALLWAFNVGFFISIIRDLCSPLLFFFVIIAMYYLEKQRYKLSSLFLVFAILTKENALLIVVPLVIYFLVKKDFKNVINYLAPLAIFGLWQFIIYLKWGYFPLQASATRLGFPFMGVINYILGVDFPVNLHELYVHFSILPILFLLIAQCYVILRPRQIKFTPYLAIILFQMLFILSLSTEIYNLPIFSLGRHSVGLFLFSILYFSERKEKYPYIFILMLVLMSIIYFIEKIIRFKVGYFIT